MAGHHARPVAWPPGRDNELQIVATLLLFVSTGLCPAAWNGGTGSPDIPRVQARCCDRGCLFPWRAARSLSPARLLSRAPNPGPLRGCCRAWGWAVCGRDLACGFTGGVAVVAWLVIDWIVIASSIRASDLSLGVHALLVWFAVLLTWAVKFALMDGSMSPVHRSAIPGFGSRFGRLRRRWALAGFPPSARGRPAFLPPAGLVGRRVPDLDRHEPGGGPDCRSLRHGRHIQGAAVSSMWWGESLPLRCSSSATSGETLRPGASRWLCLRWDGKGLALRPCERLNGLAGRERRDPRNAHGGRRHCLHAHQRAACGRGRTESQHEVPLKAAKFPTPEPNKC